MIAQPKLRSHRSRVAAAKKFIEEFGIQVSRLNREAFVEFFLLEDIRNLYEYRRNVIKGRKKLTPEGIYFQKKQLEKINYMLYMLDKCLDVLEGKLDEGAYSDVWKVIHEYQLKVTAGKLQYLDELVKLVEAMLSDVSREALETAKKMLEGNEFLEELKDHDANSRKLYDIPDDLGMNIDQVVNSDDIAEDEDNKRSDPKANLY